MKIINPHIFTKDRAWDALDIDRMDDITVRLHWTDKPYKWHVNNGSEVFVVLSGVVDMHVRDKAGVTVHALSEGFVFHAEAGDEHVAHPRGEARVLVIERAGSV